MESLVKSYFPDLTDLQYKRFEQLSELYRYWNERVNVISRKDIENIQEKHVLHSLAIAKLISFKSGTRILDVGTGGGFPGIPLAVMFPEVEFHLVDSIGKKIKVVSEVSEALGLENVKAEQLRAEQLRLSYDFIVSRAVTAFPEFYAWVRKRISPRSQNALSNGILYLKGGDLREEMSPFEGKYKEYPISDFFGEDFFETKKVIYLPLC